MQQFYGFIFYGQRNIMTIQPDLLKNNDNKFFNEFSCIKITILWSETKDISQKEIQPSFKGCKQWIVSEVTFF